MPHGSMYFTAASFYVNISSEEGERIVNTFNSRIENHPQHEIQDLAWISLNQILEAQANKENKLSGLKVTLETELGRPLSAEESYIYLEKANKRNIKLPCGRRVAHYVARTIFYGMENH